MAAFDTADLLTRCKTLAARPAVDSATTDTQWYALMTEAQAAWTNTFAAQVPWVLMSAPVVLTSAAAAGVARVQTSNAALSDRVSVIICILPQF